MKSEAKANEALSSYVERTAYEREAWAKVLAAPKASRPVSKPVKAGFFSKLFKVQ